MRSTTAVAMASGTCVAGFLAGWLVFHSDGTCKIELPPTSPLERAETPEVSRPIAGRAPDLEKPDSQPAVAPSEPLLESAPSTPSREAAAPRFAELLSMPESTRSELKAKEKSILETLPIYTHPAFEAEIAAGRIRPRWRDESEFFTPTSSASSDHADLTTWTSDTAWGEFSVALPRSKYPNLHELHDCLSRVQGRIRELEHNEFMTQREEQNARMRK